jgi:DNA modification methylase
MRDFIIAQSALDFLVDLPDASVDLFCIDPPYYKIAKANWDSQWTTPGEYALWLGEHLSLASIKLKPNGSLIMFAGLSEKPKNHCSSATG